MRWKGDCLQPPLLQNLDKHEIYISCASESFDMRMLFSIWNEIDCLLWVNFPVKLTFKSDIFFVLYKCLYCAQNTFWHKFLEVHL